MKAVVFYVKNEFFGRNILTGVAKHAQYHKVAEVDVPSLEDCFRQMNVVDGTELPVKLKVRSMSVGDVVVLGSGKVFFCAMTGWQELTSEEALKFRHDAL